MPILERLNNESQSISYFVWEIKNITDAEDETIRKYVDRDRIGKYVRTLLPIEVGMPLQLAYVDGIKEGNVIQHTRIQKILETETSVKVYTKNTMVELELV